MSLGKAFESLYNLLMMKIRASLIKTSKALFALSGLFLSVTIF